MCPVNRTLRLTVVCGIRTPRATRSSNSRCHRHLRDPVRSGPTSPDLLNEASQHSRTAMPLWHHSAGLRRPTELFPSTKKNRGDFAERPCSRSFYYLSLSEQKSCCCCLLWVALASWTRAHGEEENEPVPYGCHTYMLTGPWRGGSVRGWPNPPMAFRSRSSSCKSSIGNDVRYSSRFTCGLASRWAATSTSWWGRASTSACAVSAPRWA